MAQAGRSSGHGRAPIRTNIDDGVLIQGLQRTSGSASGRIARSTGGVEVVVRMAERGLRLPVIEREFCRGRFGDDLLAGLRGIRRGRKRRWILGQFGGLERIASRIMICSRRSRGVVAIS